MLSPTDIAPKCRAPSIWSFDSGYGSNTLEDDDIPQVCAHNSALLCARLTQAQISPTQESSSCFSPSRFAQSPIGLGITFPWNASVTDRLRLRQSSPPVEPVTTKLNVFTTKDTSNADFHLPESSNSKESCATCKLWSLTWPEKNLQCDSCRNKSCIAPEALHTFDDRLKSKNAVPRLVIPQASSSKKRSRVQTPARCSACEIAILIDPSKPIRCASCNSNSNLLSPVSPQRSYKIRRSCARRPSKLPSHALQLLQEWLSSNRNNPYPDPETKRSLAETCGITEKQVTTWFTNARARGVLKTIEHSHSGSEDEAMLETGVSNINLAPKSSAPTTDLIVESSYQPPYTAEFTEHELVQSSRRGKKKDYSHLSPVSPINYQPFPATSPSTSTIPNDPTSANDKSQETWQCTFCYQPVAPKSWRRHEETQHHPNRKWTCLGSGPCVPISTSSSSSHDTKVCAFCMLPNPSEQHLQQSHRIVECMAKDEKERTFYRPDHLRQHVKNFHDATLWDEIRDFWRKERKVKIEVENWTCGFCGVLLRTWDVRETHVAAHFKDGCTMAEWNGDSKAAALQGNAAAAAAAATSRKRRNDEEGNSNTGFLSKIARTLRGKQRRDIEPPMTMTMPTTTSAPSSSPQQTYNAASVASSSVISSTATMPPLLPDMIFDSFMAEMNATTSVTSVPTTVSPFTCMPPTTTTTATSASSLMTIPNEHFGNRCDSVFRDDAAVAELDLDLDLDALLNGEFGAFDGLGGLWGGVE